jgi:uncharacterized membrane protein YedE/YeeE
VFLLSVEKFHIILFLFAEEFLTFLRIYISHYLMVIRPFIVGPLISHNLIGLHGLLTGIAFTPSKRQLL